jgi:hypothetical protein
MKKRNYSKNKVFMRVEVHNNPRESTTFDLFGTRISK